MPNTELPAAPAVAEMFSGVPSATVVVQLPLVALRFWPLTLIVSAPSVAGL